MSGKKWALIIQGGGSRAAFASGVVDVLAEHGLYADAAYGTSAGALIACNYASHDIGRYEEILETSMTSIRFLKPLGFLFGGSLMNFPWLFKGGKTKRPMNEKEMMEGKTDLYSVSTNLAAFTSLYINRSDENFYPSLEASCSLTLFVKKPVFVGGVPALDGGYVERIPFQHALDNGFEKIVIITTRNEGWRFPEEAIHEKDEKKVAKRFKQYPKFVEGYMTNRPLYNKQIDFVEKMTREGRFFTVYPEKPLDVGLVEMKKAKTHAAYEYGREVMTSHLDSLIDYLSH